MNVMDVTSLSSKGQVVIPGRVRSRLGLRTGDKLMVVTDGDNVLLRRLAAPRLAVFQELVKESQALAQEQGIRPTAVRTALRKVRRATRP